MNMRRVFVSAWLLLWPGVAPGQPPAPDPAGPDGVTRLVAAIQAATENGDADTLRSLATRSVTASQLSDFVQSLTFPRAERSAVKERDRALTPDGKLRLLLETFTDRGGEGRVSSWRIEVVARDSAADKFGV